MNCTDLVRHLYRNLQPPLDLRGYDGIRLRIKGDEKLQTMKVRPPSLTVIDGRIPTKTPTNK